MPADAPTMPEVTSAPPGPPTPAQQFHEGIAKADIRSSQQFKSVFKNFEAKAKPMPGQDAPPEKKPEPPPKAKQEPPKPKAEPKPEPSKLASELGEDEESTPQASREEPEAIEASETEAKPETEAKAEESEVTPSKPKKLNAWKIVDEYKGKLARVEKELAAAKASAIPEAEAKQVTERLTKAEARVKELEEELRYKNYEKHPEFLKEYQQPYEAEFRRAMSELKEIPVVDAAGNQRTATADDLIAILNLPLGQAQQAAKEMFGEFTPYVMEYRRSLKSLMDKRQAAIDQVKTQGAERERQMSEAQQRQESELNQFIAETWKQAQQDTLTDSAYGRYFTPRESDPDWNQRLAKGYEVVDRAFSDPNPRDPRLTPQEREKVIRRHSAVRHRAAAFGPLRYENEKLSARVAELEKQLEEYKSTEPGSAGGAKPRASASDQSEDPMARLRSGLAKYARPLA